MYADMSIKTHSDLRADVCEVQPRPRCIVPYRVRSCYSYGRETIARSILGEKTRNNFVILAHIGVAIVKL